MPLCLMLPVPVIELVTLILSERFATKALLLVTLPPPNVPEAAPEPICSVPAEMVVPPE